MSTFQYQNQLKKLPIPDLEETCLRYLRIMEPLQTRKEHNRTKAAVEMFLKGNDNNRSQSIGRYLDDCLRKYGADQPSYIEQFWYDAYLSYDSPVVLNVNPFFLLEDDPFTQNETTSANPQIKRAATLTLSSLKFIQALKNETLSVDKLKNGKPLCMYQYSKLFGASRIPTDDGCMMQTDPDSNHIVVMSKSQFYWFDVLDSQNNIILSESELNVNFSSIIHDSLSTANTDVAKSSFGVLTTENRKLWANVRNNLIATNKVNKEVLSIIDSALFIVCLDDIELEDLSELAQNMLGGLSILDKGIQVGTCTNRWFDKLQIIITKNGKAGINFEHTGVDGHTVLRYVSDIYTDSILSFAQTINKNAPSLWKDATYNQTQTSFANEHLITIPRKLEWDLTPDLSLALRFGETRLSDLLNQNEIKHLEFRSYGSSQIKSMRFSPDAFVQMAFQATYYALYGKVECTYEPAMTKHFFHGRTEAVRTVSEESNDFVHTYFDRNATNKEKLTKLSEACKAHSMQTRLASNGEGVDRHLYALYCLWARLLKQYQQGVLNDQYGSAIPEFVGSLPPIFADAGWNKLNDAILSTSNCGNPALRLFGFGPVSANGFGIGYIIRDDSISFCVASKHRQTKRFLATLLCYLNDVESMHRNQ
ncbi:Ctn1 predicted carnitine acetyl transferase [Candida orthopsilosis Co 90-125]|uniref:Ctn1 predicted carnitine acetyl transferase n=1 Tax=Candida orthopsilosis (strain 90-125) TaxID=1136231 RepID=H8X2C8_CANO9|nr:Ctn1 predicted carnitine acetyl transferase [Candida orthopsilosis Co 90-125]CCG22850.1 Ctn1 predicted carnitine acetyl transferase [Candida orthopsilosis Co 90-125]